LQNYCLFICENLRPEEIFQSTSLAPFIYAIASVFAEFYKGALHTFMVNIIPHLPFSSLTKQTSDLPKTFQIVKRKVRGVKKQKAPCT
jgi:hypothetical protein